MLPFKLPETRRTRSGTVLGDVILAIDRKPVRTAKELYAVLDRRRVGETVTVRILRGFLTDNEQELTVAVTLQEERR